MSRQFPPQPHQVLFLVRYGTMSQLVWAASSEAAEERVRKNALDPRFTPYDLQGVKVRIHGEMTVREATKADVAEWVEAGGEPPMYFEATA